MTTAQSSGARGAGRLEGHGHLGVAPGATGKRWQSGLGSTYVGGKSPEIVFRN